MEFTSFIEQVDENRPSLTHVAARDSRLLWKVRTRNSLVEGQRFFSTRDSDATHLPDLIVIVWLISEDTNVERVQIYRKPVSIRSKI